MATSLKFRKRLGIFPNFLLQNPPHNLFKDLIVCILKITENQISCLYIFPFDIWVRK